jgi:hypothetical protein
VEKITLILGKSPWKKIKINVSKNKKLFPVLRNIFSQIVRKRLKEFKTGKSYPLLFGGGMFL